MRIDEITDFVMIVFMSILFLPVFYLNFNTKKFIGYNIIGFNSVFYTLHLLILIRRPVVFVSRPMLYAYLYYFIFFVYSVSGFFDTSNMWFWHYQKPVYVATLIYTYYYIRQDYRGFATIVSWALAFITMSAILNIIQLHRYPDAARFMFMGARSQGYIALEEFYTRIGVAGYVFTNGVTYLVPVAIGLFKYGHSKLVSNFGLIFTILIAYSVLLSSITAPILVVAMGIIISIMGRVRLKASLFILFVFSIMLTAVPKTFYANIFYYASYTVKNKDVAVRLKDIGTSIESGIDVNDPETSMDNRAERIPRNISRFLESPLVGNAPEKVGDEHNFHTFWFYYFAQFGLVGGIPLLIALFSNIRRNLPLIGSEFQFYYLTSVLMFFILGILKGFANNMMIYFMIITPGICLLEKLRKDRVESAVPVPLTEPKHA